MATSWSMWAVTLMLMLSAGCVNQTAEPAGPAEAELTFQREDLAVREPIPLLLHFTPRQPAHRAEVRLEAKGAIAVEGEDRTTWTAVGAGRTMTLPVRVRAAGAGEGELRAVVDVYSDDGRLLYQVAPGVDFLVTDELVLAGYSGTLELKLEYLDYQLAQGKISPDQHKEKREQLLGGGAESKIKVEDE